MRSYFHSFIHSGDFKTLLLRGAPSPVTAKEQGLEGDVKFGRADHQQVTQLNGEVIPCRWAHNRKGTSLKSSYMGPRDQKLTPRSRTQHPTRCQNRHWAADTTIDLSKFGENQNIGEKKAVITNESMGVSQLLGSVRPGHPQSLRLWQQRPQS